MHIKTTPNNELTIDDFYHSFNDNFGDGLLMFIDVYWCLLGLPDYTPSHPKFFLHSWLITALKWLRTCPSRYTPLFLDNPKGTLGMMWAKCARLPNFVNLNNWWYLVQHIYFLSVCSECGKKEDLQNWNLPVSRHDQSSPFESARKFCPMPIAQYEQCWSPWWTYLKNLDTE